MNDLSLHAEGSRPTVLFQKASRQRTLAGEHTLEGVGVHTGESASLTMGPAAAGGVLFRRLDLSGSPEIPADLDHVVACEMGTSLGAGEARVQTVEHVMAALYAGGVDHAVIELRGPEAPILDGSFQRYLAAVSDVGTVELEAPARVISVRRRLKVTTLGGSSYVVTPANALRVSATIDFEHQSIGRQHSTFVMSEEAFRREIAPARTFGFHHDAEALRARGLAQGTSLENTIVLDDEGIMNESLRFDDEFVRHKIGDLIGDLALIGRRVRGHIVSECPSHEGNIKLARTLLRHAQTTSHDLPIEVEQIMEHLPPPVSVPLGGSGLGVRTREKDRRPQERHDQRTLLSRAFSRAPGHAGSPDHRSHGAGRWASADGLGV